MTGKWLLRVGALAVAYIGAGKLGLLLAIPPANATAIWPPAGVALGALLVGGVRLWPGVALGGFLLNFHLSMASGRLEQPTAMLGLAAATGLGAALQAALGAHLLRRLGVYPSELDDEVRLGRFILFGGAFVCPSNATVGTAALVAAGLVEWHNVAFRWWTWWVQDTLGSILIGPLVVLALSALDPRRLRRLLSVAAPVALACALVLWLFLGVSRAEDERLGHGEAAQSAASAGGPRSWRTWSVLSSGLTFVALLQALLLVHTGRTRKVELLVDARDQELRASYEALSQQRGELARSNADLASALQAKELLLRELHHRVKNNLQVIASLFSLQARSAPDQQVRAVLEQGQNRVLSIALAHEELYRSKDLARIDFSEYVRNLVEHLRVALGGVGGRVRIETDLGEVRLPVDVAIPCGLLLNELVTNAFKHAFPGGRPGLIRVGLRAIGPERWTMQVEDDGVGLPAGIDVGKTPSLGLDLVSILAAQLGASIAVERSGGTQVRLAFGGAGAAAAAGRPA